MKHKHCENMALYARDATETDKPWERWQYADDVGSGYRDIYKHPEWRLEFEYRRKPRTININGHDVPEPVRNAYTFQDGQKYYYVTLDYLVISKGVTNDRWETRGVDLARLKAGIIHLTREAAEAHAKALLSFTEKQP